MFSHGLAPCVPLRLPVLGSLPGTEAREPVVCGSQKRSLPSLPAASPSPRCPRVFAFLHAERQRPRVTCPLTLTECGAGRCWPAFLFDVLYRARTRGPPSRFSLTGQPLQRQLVPTPCVDPPYACICRLTRACPPCLQCRARSACDSILLPHIMLRSCMTSPCARAFRAGPPKREPARALHFVFRYHSWDPTSSSATQLRDSCGCHSADYTSVWSATDGGHQSISILVRHHGCVQISHFP